MIINVYLHLWTGDTQISVDCGLKKFLQVFEKDNVYVSGPKSNKDLCSYYRNEWMVLKRSLMRSEQMLKFISFRQQKLSILTPGHKFPVHLWEV